MPKIITAEQILSWEPCAPDISERIRELIGAGKTPIEILDLDIPIYDKFWVVLREEIIPVRELRLLLCDFAWRVLPEFEQKFPLDKRPRNAIEVARRYANGEATVEELITAEVRAWDASRSAAIGAAAWAAWAAWAAACAAATVCAAVWTAMSSACAARNAAIAAALTEEASAQLEMVREVLMKIEEKGE